MNCKKIIIKDNPFPIKKDCHYANKVLLSCYWIGCDSMANKEAEVYQYQLDFTLEKEESFRMHVSADQQYILLLDGEYVGRGCEMKSPENWYFETYEIELPAGKHKLSVLVWNYGDLSPMNRMSVKPGFFLQPDEALVSQLGTGVAPWKVRKMNGISFDPIKIIPHAWMSVPPHEKVTCKEFYKESEWQESIRFEQGYNGLLCTEEGVHLLKPAITDVMLAEPAKIGTVIVEADSKPEGGYVPESLNYGVSTAQPPRSSSGCASPDPIIHIEVEAQSEKRLIIDLENYYCAYSLLKVRQGQGSTVRITWAEAAFTDPEKPEKGQRNDVLGKYFRGTWDEFILDGEARVLSPLAWRCGRFIELHIVTADEPLLIDNFFLKETRYPLEMDGAFSCNDEEINEIVPFAFRTLQMCAHDNFMDCPFYEQLLYSGDGRLEALVSLMSCHDDTLARKAIQMFAASRDISGFTMARWPSNFRQYIPSFSLWWVGIVYDYALWRDDLSFIREQMPTVRTLLDNVLARLDNDGFLHGREWEWNFIDWVDEWANSHNQGLPPGIENGANATYNWLLVYILGLAEKLEEYVDEPLLAERWRQYAQNLAEKLHDRFWNDEKSIFQEDDSGKHVSPHCQILAMLSGMIDEQKEKQLKESFLNTEWTIKPSIFYRHYLFELYQKMGAPEQILNGLGLWRSFIENGFSTAPETPVNKTFNQRSDCHGWGAHPVYHLIANIAGIKPAEMGFKKVLIAPQLGKLKNVHAKCVHPKGIISVDFEKTVDDGLKGTITLPPGLEGELRYRDRVVILNQPETCF